MTKSGAIDFAIAPWKEAAERYADALNRQAEAIKIVTQELSTARADAAVLRAFCDKVRNMSTGGDTMDTVRERWQEMLNNDVELMKEANEICESTTSGQDLLDKMRRMEAALEPFANYYDAFKNVRVEDDMPITPGSHMARKQLTVGDIRRAVEAIKP